MTRASPTNSHTFLTGSSRRTHAPEYQRAPVPAADVGPDELLAVDHVSTGLQFFQELLATRVPAQIERCTVPELRPAYESFRTWSVEEIADRKTPMVGAE